VRCARRDVLFLCAEPSYGRDAPPTRRFDPGDNEVERPQDGDKSLDAQQDAEDYEIEDIYLALARRAILERTTRTDHTAYGSAATQGHGANTLAQRYVDDS
jgi:hypothetical protein